MDQLYIEIEIITKNDDTQIFTSVASFLSLYTYRYINSANIKLNFVRSSFLEDRGKLRLRSDLLRSELTEKAIICKKAADLQAIRDLRLPIYAKNESTYIAGTCAVCREIIDRQTCPERRKLLGFKGSCLLAPAEASIWTRFCEVDVVDALNNLLIGDGAVTRNVRVELVRFEQHLNEPVRMHNIYKLARNQANQSQPNGKKIKRKDKVVIECTTPKEDLLIEHRFAEGISFTIADLLLYPLIRMIFQHFAHMLQFFPLTSTWLSEIDNFDSSSAQILSSLYVPQSLVLHDQCLVIPDCESTSLYKADPKRYKPRNRIYTSQSEIDVALAKLSNQNLYFSSDSDLVYGDQTIDWSLIEPTHAESSALPQNRLERKRQQLENMANAVISLTTDGDRIIDFCSGTGHLAILLALQLPQCTVIVMENKPFSMAQAQKRAAQLNLSNCRFYQCNIDYFEGVFEVGTSLHACGTATDIVLQQCQRVGARFVCCPCCYGSLSPMPHITYPLSSQMRNLLDQKDYLYIAHTADQAHDLGTRNCKPEITKQGRLCMCIVDTDRKLKAEEAGYQVTLTRLKPEECTPKNHLLLGRYVGSLNNFCK